MNTGEKNSQGRVIYSGPRGGRYVLGPGGKKIRTFKPAAAAPVPAGSTNTGTRNTLGRIIYTGSRGGRFVLGPGGKKIRKFKEGAAHAHAPGTPIPKKMAKYKKFQNTFVSKSGRVYDRHGVQKTNLSPRQSNDIFRGVYALNKKYLRKPVIPFINNSSPVPAKLKLFNPQLQVISQVSPRTWGASVYFDKDGRLYYVTLDGRKVLISDNIFKGGWKMHYFRFLDNPLRQVIRQVAAKNARYPRSAVPANTPPPPNRSSPELLNNMMNQIYTGGRGSNINAGRYTNAEKAKLVARLKSSIEFFARQRDAKKANVAIARLLHNTARAAASNERVGYYNNAVRAYTRGLRALEPLKKTPNAQSRTQRATPNRSTPAPPSEEFNAIYMPLNRPHLVVKTPGVGTIYLNPNSFRGLMKNAARVNIAEGNVRDWLRTARRTFPNEPLFRHPHATNKNVTARHIRFSRAM